jgi:hypothetical protein
MTGYQWLDVLIAIAGAMLLTSLVLIAVCSLVLIAVIARGRHEGKTAKMEAAYRRFSSDDTPSGRNRRRRLRVVLPLLLILNLVSLGILLSRAGELEVESTSTQSATPGAPSPSASPSPASDPGSRPTSTRTPDAGDNPGSGSPAARSIQLKDLAFSARPFQTVRIQGTYQGVAEAFLRVERWEGGNWLAFPLPTKTDQSGQFTTYVEFGQPGRYRLRVLDTNTGVTSKVFVIVINA